MKKIFIALVMFCCACSSKAQQQSEAMDLWTQAAGVVMRNFPTTDSLEYVVDLLSQAIDKDPSNTQIYLDKVKFLGKLGEYDEALNTLSIVADKDPNSSMVPFLQGVIMENKGDSLAAQSYYAKSLVLYDKKNGNSSNVYDQLGRATIQLMLYQPVDLNIQKMDIPDNEPMELIQYHVSRLENFDRQEFLSSVF